MMKGFGVPTQRRDKCNSNIADIRGKFEEYYVVITPTNEPKSRQPWALWLQQQAMTPAVAVVCDAVVGAGLSVDFAALVATAAVGAGASSQRFT